MDNPLIIGQYGIGVSYELVPPKEPLCYELVRYDFSKTIAEDRRSAVFIGRRDYQEICDMFVKKSSVIFDKAEHIFNSNIPTNSSQYDLEKKAKSSHSTLGLSDLEKE